MKIKSKDFRVWPGTKVKLTEWPTKVKPIEFLGLHISTTDNHFIPPAVGALMLVGGIVQLVVKPKSVG